MIDYRAIAETELTELILEADEMRENIRLSSKRQKELDALILLKLTMLNVSDTVVMQLPEEFDLRIRVNRPSAPKPRLSGEVSERALHEMGVPGGIIEQARWASKQASPSISIERKMK